MNREIVWLRQDLRVADNSLFHFTSPPDQLLCVHVLEYAWLAPALPGINVPRIGPARLQFLWQSLIALRGELLKRGSDLLVRVGDPVEVIAGLAEQLGASRIRVRPDAGHDEAEAVSALAIRLAGRAEVTLHESGLLFAEADLPIAVADLPSSFSAFRRQAEKVWRVPASRQAPVTLPPWPREAARGLPPLREVCSKAADWQPDPRGHFRFSGGEAAGQERLEHYLWVSSAVARYRQTRNDLVGADFSTRLSPWLAHGCLSARQVHDAVRAWEAEHGGNDSSYWVVFELLWRDYFHWAARREGGAFFGERRLPPMGDVFHAWRCATTGVPFVDAAMRELAATGWLSNRARQNAASFLVRHLKGDWRQGAAWFEHCLIDHDVASNWGNWRYLAGVGRDRHSRALDVHAQAEHYDPHGAYAALWQAPNRLDHPEER